MKPSYGRVHEDTDTHAQARMCERSSALPNRYYSPCTASTHPYRMYAALVAPKAVTFKPRIAEYASTQHLCTEAAARLTLSTASNRQRPEKINSQSQRHTHGNVCVRECKVEGLLLSTNLSELPFINIKIRVRHAKLTNCLKYCMKRFWRRCIRHYCID
jgi:hypothetical protein